MAGSALVMIFTSCPAMQVPKLSADLTYLTHLTYLTFPLTSAVCWPAISRSPRHNRATCSRGLPAPLIPRTLPQSRPAPVAPRNFSVPGSNKDDLPPAAKMGSRARNRTPYEPHVHNPAVRIAPQNA